MDQKDELARLRKIAIRSALQGFALSAGVVIFSLLRVWQIYNLQTLLASLAKETTWGSFVGMGLFMGFVMFLVNGGLRFGDST